MKVEGLGFVQLERKRLGGNTITVFQYKEDKKGISFTKMHGHKRQHTQVAPGEI